MLVDIKGERESLTQSQLDYLLKAIPWARFIQYQTCSKAMYFKRVAGTRGLLASIFLADTIITTNWGTHPIAKDIFKNKAANNLLLLQSTPLWTGKIGKYEDKQYKLFESWESFSIHYSDLISFSPTKLEVLKKVNLSEQSALYCLQSGYSISDNKRIIDLISDYQLMEFDL